MSHSLNKIWIHSIWSVKDRQKLILPNFENKLQHYINAQFQELGCFVKSLNSCSDHVHCLFLLNSKLSLIDVMKQVKGSSSHYINQNNFIKEKFSWQTGFASFSVSDSLVDRVSNYIQNQKEHHRKKTFQEEIEEIYMMLKKDN